MNIKTAIGGVLTLAITILSVAVANVQGEESDLMMDDEEIFIIEEDDADTGNFFTRP